MKEENICRLLDPNLIVAPHDKGSPPSWVPAFHGEEVVWVDREIFDKLKELRDNQPCNICPNEIKKKCKLVENHENVINDIELQKKKVHEKIDPILKLYNKDKITAVELVEKLAEAFRHLEEDEIIVQEMRKPDDVIKLHKTLEDIFG